MKILAVFALVTASALADTLQDHVHHHAGDVMPFDMAKTAHIFAMTDQGGVQKVVTRNASDAHQIALIRLHLKFEADAFKNGET